jgi:hypothetical protein
MLTHILIVGQTLSGKSQLARRLCGRIRAQGKSIIVYDPTLPAGGPRIAGWPGLVCTDWAHLERVFWASRGCFVVIDEALDAFSTHKLEARAMLTRGRHIDPASGGGGHCVCLVSQRHRLLDKTARDQCSSLFAFTVNPKDAQDLADDWNCPELLRLPQTPPLIYCHVRRHSPARWGRLSFS